MELIELGEWEMTYRTLELLDYGAGGQNYGEASGARLVPGGSEWCPRSR